MTNAYMALSFHRNIGGVYFAITQDPLVSSTCMVMSAYAIEFYCKIRLAALWVLRWGSSLRDAQYAVKTPRACTMHGHI
jgi:hypothetical protein